MQTEATCRLGDVPTGRGEHVLDVLVGDDLECVAFLLIEFPIGCWFCETPGLTALVMVELPEGDSLTFTREPLEVTEKRKLNKTDRESFLFQIVPAKVKVGG